MNKDSTAKCIVVAWITDDGLHLTGKYVRPDGVNWTAEAESCPQARAVIWLNRGGLVDIQKAEAYAAEQGATVYTFPPSVRDPLGQARALVMQLPASSKTSSKIANTQEVQK